MGWGGSPAEPLGPGSSIEFRLDARSGVPTYLQLVQQVEHALRLGYLRPGDQLPRVRDVVSLLAINPNTVLKAYRELEHKGLVAGRPGQGTFVEATLGEVALPRADHAAPVPAGLAGHCRRGGLDEDAMVALFTSTVRDFREHRAGSTVRRGAVGGQTEGVA